MIVAVGVCVSAYVEVNMHVCVCAFSCMHISAFYPYFKDFLCVSLVRVSKRMTSDQKRKRRRKVVI